MRCGRNHQHATVDEVRQCYAQRYGWAGTPAPAPQHAANWGYNPASDPRAMAGADAEPYRHPSRRDLASTASAQVAADLRRPGAISLNPGGYALPSATGNNDLDFFWLTTPEEGKWKGWTFAERVIGGRSNQNLRREEQIKVLGRIARLTPDQRQAAQRSYGVNLGECYHCHRSLTDEDSRRLGIGPVCRNK